jgi:HSP90 family molecular chaperone
MEQLGIKQDIAKLQQILGSKLYSNKYSFLSEVLQNSTDAMRKCGKQDEAFEVGIVNKNEKTIFYTRDTGCSFDSIERFKELMNLLESSKSQVKDSSENQELGKFGIGEQIILARFLHNTY